MKRSLRAQVLVWQLRRNKNTNDISDSFEQAAALEVDARPAPVPPRSLANKFAIERRLVSDTAVFVIRPARTNPTRAVLHVHGGGYTDDITDGTWSTAAALARRADAEVWLVAYRLAPRQTAPRTVAEVTAVYERMLESWSSRAIAGVGDSAGGGLLLAATQAGIAQGLCAPGLLALISPWVDVTMSDADPDLTELRDPMLSRNRLLGAGRAYAGELDLTDPRVSPINGRIQGLPPIWITAAGDDMLVHQGRRLRDVLTAASVPVHYIEDAGMMHVHALMPIPEGRRALRWVLDAIRELRESTDVISPIVASSDKADP